MRVASPIISLSNEDYLNEILENVLSQVHLVDHIVVTNNGFTDNMEASQVFLHNVRLLVG